MYERYGDVEVVMEDTDWTGVERYHDEGDFFIDRKECGFYPVLQKLMEYFSDKVITDGICQVEGTSIRWTMFHIKTKDD